MTAIARTAELTRSVEDYLKAIYRLGAAGRPVSTSQIAQRLELSAPSVTGMIKRLADQGLLEHVPYKGVQLTHAGRRVALRMLRRHRLIEAYLVAFLGYTWDTVHAEAERLEHAVSDALVERMAQTLGNPDVDPHGDPIPAPDGSIAEVRHVPLTDVPTGETVEVRRVRTDDDGRLRYIATMDLVPGARVTVLERQPFEGPLTVEVNERQRVLAHDMGAIVLCEREDV